MKLSPSELQEIRLINEKIQSFWNQFKPHEKKTFSECGLITVWYLPKLIEHIIELEHELSSYR
jgi:hypothetical protein